VSEAVADLRPLATVEETAKVLRVCTRQVRRLTVAGRLHAVRAAHGGSSRLLVPRASIEKYLRSLDGEA
jgi:excisionase family DNA binding protein